MKLLLLLAMLTVFLVPALVVAETEYFDIGGTGDDFLQGSGGFNENNALTTIQVRGLTSGAHTPLVADLDGDGDNEIVVIDGATLEVYENVTLDLIDTIALHDPASEYAPATLFDYDNDTLVEIMVFSESRGTNSLTVYNFTGGVISQERQDTGWGADSSVVGEVEGVIACTPQDAGPARCLVLATESSASVASVFVTGFNSTFKDNPALLDFETPSASDTLCFSRIPSIPVVDYDADGRNEFVIAYMWGRGGANEELRIEYVDIDDSGLDFSSELSITETGNDPWFFSGSDGSCSTPSTTNGLTAGDVFTSPLVGDFQAGSGLETVVGMMTADDEFEMYVYDSAGAQLDTHPKFPDLLDVTQADGQIVGNPIQMNVFGDTGEGRDYCVQALHNDDNEIGLLCGSLSTGRTVIGDDNTVEFVFDRTGLFNISSTYDLKTTIGHASEMFESNIDLGVTIHNPPELVNTYGVFELTDTEVGAGLFDFNKFELNRIFSLSAERACIVADYEKTDASDFICTTTTQLAYVNDNVQKGAPAITGIDLNPCFNGGLIGVNTTFQTDVTAVDQNDFPLDQDSITTRVIIYYGDANQQNSSDLTLPSGETHTHLFTHPPGAINQTGTLNVRYEVWDADNVASPAVITRTGTVGVAGVQFGDCSQSISFVEEEEEEEDVFASLLVDADDNAIVTGFTTLGGTVGLGLTTFALFLLFIISISVFWFGVANGVSGNAVLGLVAILNVFGLFIGARLGFFGTGFIVIITVVGVVILGVFLGKFITGVGSGGE